jgi:membrane dipeptidase
MIGPGEPDGLQRARALHARSILIDTHCDTTARLAKAGWDFGERHADGHVDLPRLREGGVSTVFFAVFAPGPVKPGAGVSAAKRQLDLIHSLIEHRPDELALVRSADDVRTAKASGRIGIGIGIEGGYLIEDSLDVMGAYHAAGASYLTLTHGFHTSWADSSGIHERLPPRHGGLTDFGRAVVRELNRLGMMVDVSHVSDDTLHDVLETTTAPIIATHSSCRAVAPHTRNLSDEMIRAIAAGGGVVQINFAAMFVDPDHPPLSAESLADMLAGRDMPPGLFGSYVTPLQRLVDHFDHALKLVGPEHVGIGSDFDGVQLLPDGMEDCSKLPYLTAALLERGWREDDIALMLGENVLRVMETCARVASDG